MAHPENNSSLGKKELKQIRIKKDDVGEEEEEPISPNGAIFHNPLISSYILVIIGLENFVHVPSMKTALQSTLSKHKRFSSILMDCRSGYQKWVPKELNIDDHIIVPELSADFTENPDFVEKYTATLATDPALDTSIPLWQIHVLNCRSAEAESSVVFKIHHSIGDCISLMSLFLDCTTKRSNPDSMPTIPRIHKGNENSAWKVANILHTIWTIMISLWYTVLNLLHAAATFLWMKDSKVVRGLPGVASHPKRLAHVTVDLEDIVIVKKAIKGTVNDVVSGMLSAGFVRYFNRLYSKDGARWRPPRIRAIVPVNLRSSPGLHKLEYMFKHPREARWGNPFGLWMLPISVKERHEFLEYCRVAKVHSDKKKSSFEAPFVYSFAALGFRLFGWKAAVLLYRTLLNTTLVFSNVLGPVEPVQFLDNPVSHIVTTVSGFPQGLDIHFQSYAGKAKFIAMAADDVFPDPQQLCMDCAYALAQMKKEALFANTDINCTKVT